MNLFDAEEDKENSQPSKKVKIAPPVKKKKVELVKGQKSISSFFKPKAKK